jgi:hypothetical protein
MRAGQDGVAGLIELRRLPSRQRQCQRAICPNRGLISWIAECLSIPRKP